MLLFLGVLEAAAAAAAAVAALGEEVVVVAAMVVEAELLLLDLGGLGFLEKKEKRFDCLVVFDDIVQSINHSLDEKYGRIGWEGIYNASIKQEWNGDAGLITFQCKMRIE